MRAAAARDHAVTRHCWADFNTSQRGQLRIPLTRLPNVEVRERLVVRDLDDQECANAVVLSIDTEALVAVVSVDWTSLRPYPEVAEPVPPVLPTEVVLALAAWHEALGDECVAASEGQECCLDALLTVQPVSPLTLKDS